MSPREYAVTLRGGPALTCWATDPTSALVQVAKALRVSTPTLASVREAGGPRSGRVWLYELRDRAPRLLEAQA